MKNLQITITPEDTKNANGVSITLEGELILRNMQEMAEEVKTAINKYQTITIELKNIVNIDLACIQLLLAAKQTAISEKKHITCQVQLPAEVKNVMHHSGLANFTDLLNK